MSGNSNIKRSVVGSSVFGTDIVKTNEYIMFAENMQEKNVSVPVIAARITAIDRMLLMQRNKSLNSMNMFTKTGRKRKDTGLFFLIDKIIYGLIEEENEINKSLNQKSTS
jgi:hypothetical protein